MEYVYSDGEFKFELVLDESMNLHILVINRSLCVEYSLTISNLSNIFNNRPIINTTKMFYNMLIDAFEKKNNLITLSYFITCEKTFLVCLTIDAVYINDSIRVELNHVKKNVTPKQVIEIIDYKFSELVPKIETQINSLKEFYMTLTENDKQMFSTEITENDKHFNSVCDNIKTDVENLRIVHENLYSQFDEYINMMPIMTCSTDLSRYTHNNTHMYTFQYTFPIYNSIDKIEIGLNDTYNLIVPFGSIKSIGECRTATILDFHIGKFKYFRNLKEIKFSGCKFINLEFLNVNDKLINITLDNLTELTSIAHLNKFDNLEKITISGVCKVKDLHTLTSCKNLKVLSVPKGTNTGCFPTAINFEIKILG